MVGFWISPEFLITGEARGEWTSAQGDGYDRLSGRRPSRSTPRARSST
jgi:hypothetical protein